MAGTRKKSSTRRKTSSTRRKGSTRRNRKAKKDRAGNWTWLGFLDNTWNEMLEDDPETTYGEAMKAAKGPWKQYKEEMGIGEYAEC